MVYPDHLGREHEQPVDFDCRESTIQRMELVACIRAVEWICENEPWPNITRVQIITDSKYLAENLARARGWQKNRWRNRYNEPKQNSDLWQRLLVLLGKPRVRVDILQTKGKKSRELKAVDAAARAAGLRGQGVDRGYQRGKIVRSFVKGSATPFPAHGQTAVVRPYRKNVIRKAEGENKIRFNVWDEDKQEYVQSFYAYSAAELSVQLHCHHRYRVEFNSEPRYPQIVSILEEIIIGN